MFTSTNALTTSELSTAIIRNPIVLPPETTVMAAIRRMSELRSQCETQQDLSNEQQKLYIEMLSSCVLVVENDQILGIVTERDVVRLSAERRPLDALPIREVMTHPVLTLRESDFTDLFMAVNLIQQRRIRHLPIVDDQDLLVGIITHESLRQTSRPVDLLRLRLVSDVMTRNVVCAKQDQLMLEVAKLMASNHVSSVLITDDRHDQQSSSPLAAQVPIGIVTERDIVQFQALGLDLASCTASEMMSSPVFSVKPTDSLWAVHQLMEKHFISRLAVTDRHNQLLGIVTQSSLLQSLNPIELYNLASVLEQKVSRLESEKIALLENRNIQLEQQQVLTYQQLQEQLLERQKAELALVEVNQSLEDKIFERTEDLRASKAKLSAMIYALPDLLLRVNRNGDCLEYINTGEYQELFSPVHHNISEVLPPDLLQRQLAAIDQALTMGHLQVYEHELYDNSHRLIFEEVRIVPISDDEAMVIVRNQTDQKRTELALKASEVRFRGIFDANIVGMLFVNHQGEIIDANDCFLDLIGYSRADLQGDQLNWAKMIPSEYLPVDMHTIAHVRLNGVIEPWEKLYYHRDGHPVYVLVGLAMLSEEECVCVIVDISDLKRTEKDLQQKLAAIESAIDGIAVLENDKYIYMNHAHAEIFGYADVEDLLGKSWQALYLPSELERFGREVFPVLERDKSWTGEVIAIRKDGSTFDEGLSLTMTNDGLLICVCRDISDRKYAEQIIGQQAQQEVLLREITQRIRRSLNLQTIFDTACQEIRQMLKADRVGIFKFDVESGYDDGEFVAEASVSGLRSVLAQPVHDHCFGEDYAQSYLEGEFSAINDIYNHGLTPCHIEVLAQFQIRANLIIPLLCGEELWGLLCVHQCESSRQWQKFEINLTQQIGTQLAIAIQQASLYEQMQIELQTRKQAELRLQQQAEEERLFSVITQRIRSNLHLSEILSVTVAEMHRGLDCDRMLVYRVYPNGTGAVIAESVSPQCQSILDIVFPEEVFPQVNSDRYVQGRVFALRDRQSDPLEVLPCLVKFLEDINVRAKLVVPIVQKDTLWGLLIAHQCDRPRTWQEQEINLMQKVSDQLAIAIQQASLFEQLQRELGERQQAQQQLTERNEQLAISNEELARATRLKDEFLANMSHELRTPLNAILGMTEGLEEGIFGNVSDSQINALKTIERSGSHLLELINDILDVAKIESGQIELEYSTVSVESLCQSSLAFIKQQAFKKRIQLHTKFPKQIPELNVDQRRIRQVLINLLNNAVKFTPEDGSIILEATVQPLDANAKLNNPDIQGYLRIAITDTGIGISAESIGKLFQPFIQIDSALNRQYQGTGLGLALVKRIVEMHGGQVILTSEIGVGSCFMIDIPYTDMLPDLSKSNQNTNSTTFNQTGMQSSRAAQILLVEDNEANIMTISSYLTAKGYEIILASNGQEALDTVQSLQPDLILMDIQMPIMDGLEATQKIRQLPAFAKTPIVALTALAMKSDIERCLAAGATSYLSKPIKLRELATTIHSLLNSDST